MSLKKVISVDNFFSQLIVIIVLAVLFILFKFKKRLRGFLGLKWQRQTKMTFYVYFIDITIQKIRIR